ncbi:uncharacterized protein YdeI (YjbR/CyaY-like superfamily) [Lewinella aquimaris]|uniref:Uncharacterized protein YdeI (YjbR/CyaY-like superfamily) n=1 Tax=Neolewinella aquimaris TaxID=1835722 RepID=A0A840EBC6_9BACT|nr:DUF1801 domain-containing protein [Neolewinella aquimaris]MBB4080835.1 uncharacterized protein YdeI (YjbR/CyaY-like superfamily) [Neolewinella aquimaris]
MNPKVDAYLGKAKKWQPEMEKLRGILLAAGLEEEFKWGKPCYAYEGSNVVVIAGFKPHCALMFFKGALLKDPHGLLVQPGEHTQAMRQLRFTGLEEIRERQPILEGYLKQAKAVEKAGLKVKLKKTSELEVPEEFQRKLTASPELKTAFEALTPGRQRAYLIHFGSAKQSKTRVSRVERYVAHILSGKGVDDR